MRVVCTVYYVVQKQYTILKKLICISVVSLVVIISSCSDETVAPKPENPANMPYEVEIDPDDFVSEGIVGNDFFSLESGRTMVYEGEDGEVIKHKFYAPGVGLLRAVGVKGGSDYEDLIEIN